MRSDSDIKRDVEDELRWDPEISSDDIAVAVKNGVYELHRVLCGATVRSCRPKPTPSGFPAW